MTYGERINLVVCQLSKVDDWHDHFAKYYGTQCIVCDILAGHDVDSDLDCDDIIQYSNINPVVLITNYDYVWRSPLIKALLDTDIPYTLMLDESSLIQNDKAERTKFIMRLHAKHNILLSGTPCSGRYENLYTQARLLGWDISRTAYDKTYVNWQLVKIWGLNRIVRQIDKARPYKNVDRLKRKLREHGAVFLKTEEVLDLPEQIFNKITVDTSLDYCSFRHRRVIEIGDKKIVGNTSLTYRLGLREVASIYSEERVDSLIDLIESTGERVVVFYNFNAELERIERGVKEIKRPYSVVNGQLKDLTDFYKNSDGVALVQYQAGAMGLNLQEARYMVFYSLPERSDLFEQAKKRIHRIGQKGTCYYYILEMGGSIDEMIYRALEQKKDYTDELFREDFNIVRTMPVGEEVMI